MIVTGGPIYCPRSLGFETDERIISCLYNDLTPTLSESVAA